MFTIFPVFLFYSIIVQYFLIFPFLFKVANISSLVTQDILETLFSKIGSISKLTLSASPFQDGSQECLIEFEDPSSANVSMHLTGTELGDRMLIISTISNSTSTSASTSHLNSSSLVTPSSSVSNSNSPNSILKPAMAPLHPPQPSSVPHPAIGALGMASVMTPYGLAPAATAFSSLPMASPFALNLRNPLFNPAFMQLQYDPSRAEEIARTIYVGNIAPHISEKDLTEVFSACGPVSYMKMAGDPAISRFAFIDVPLFNFFFSFFIFFFFFFFFSVLSSLILTFIYKFIHPKALQEAANEAMKLSGSIIGDRPIK